MKRIGLLLAMAISAGLVAGSPAAARNYDCTKPGNANKAACKTQAPKAAPAAKATPATAPKPVAKATPAAAAKPAPTKATAARNYDCTKPGNANKTACKGVATTAAAAPAPAKMAAAKPAATRPAAAAAATSAKPATAQVAGAVTAQCKDGTLSHAAHRSGACSQHGGVAAWR